jgi:plasmid rolling circle replication initiator protein Rep
MKIERLGGRIVLLSEMSPSDYRFQKWRSMSMMVAELYRGTEYKEYGKAIEHCGRYLRFKKVEITDEIFGITETKLLLEAANFCRIRFCIFCQWRKSLMWHGKVLKGVSRIMEVYPEHRWLAVTLAGRNCHPTVLRRELNKMNDGLRKLFGLGGGVSRNRGVGKYLSRVVEGYICTTEVTRGKDNSCHPHFHILLLVKPEYFDKEAGLYIPQQSSEKHENPGWVELWQEAFGVSYRPTAHVKAVRRDDLKRQVCEVLKYNTKPSSVWYEQKVDINGLHREGFEETQKWLVEVTGQVYKARFIKTGGCVKKLLRGLEEEPKDLIHVEDEDCDVVNSKGESVTFGWIGSDFYGLDLSYYALVNNETGELVIEENVEE